MKQPIVQPPVVRYNLKDRGRQFRGQERKFNIAALCDNIMGGATQERVRTRAMLGYFGHKPRILAGMEPAESMVIDGKYNEIEPAIVTVKLTCDRDGNVEHQTEFLDTPSGRKAARMFANRIGGFSSVIDQSRNEYVGQDYVLDPNFSHNRPYSLDSIGLTFDQVISEIKDEEEEFLQRLIETKDVQIAQLAAALDSATVENEQLISILASKTDREMALDSAAIMPILVSLDSAERLHRDRNLFMSTATLPHFVEPSAKKDEQKDDSYGELLDRMGYR